MDENDTKCLLSVSGTVSSIVLSTHRVAGLLREAVNLREPEHNQSIRLNPSQNLPSSVHQVPQVAVVGAEVEESIPALF